MINTWNESLLHEELKEYFRGENGRTEIPVDGSICDVVLEDNSIVEVQTKNLGKLKKKLEKLLIDRKVNLVHPIARNTLIETYSPEGILVSRRKSPKHGNVYQLFHELTGIWQLVKNPNLTISVIETDILELRIADGTGSWRRKGIRTDDRKLIRIHEIRKFRGEADFRALVPGSLGASFTAADLGQAGAGINAGRMAWVLRKIGILELSGKRGRAFLYRLRPSDENRDRDENLRAGTF
jgi:hypothetical protein